MFVCLKVVNVFLSTRQTTDSVFRYIFHFRSSILFSTSQASQWEITLFTKLSIRTKSDDWIKYFCFEINRIPFSSSSNLSVPFRRWLLRFQWTICDDCDDDTLQAAVMDRKLNLIYERREEIENWIWSKERDQKSHCKPALSQVTQQQKEAQAQSRVDRGYILMRWWRQHDDDSNLICHPYMLDLPVA